MDGLDFLLNELKNPQSNKEIAFRKTKTNIDIDNSKNVKINNMYNNNNSDTVKVKRIESGLKDLINNLADEEIRNRINIKLQRIKFQSFMEYYLREANLGLYSIEKELKRMDFYLIKDGNTVNDHDGILSIFEKHSLNDLWRLANQSIYAEILIALQDKFLKPELSISIVSTSSIFHLNFDLNKVTACSVFQFMTLSDEGNGRLILGKDTCIYVCLSM